MNADFGFRNLSDPYVKISGIGPERKTKVIYDDLNPVWNETFYIMIDEIYSDPQLLFEVFDQDEINDDFLGRFSLFMHYIYI